MLGTIPALEAIGVHDTGTLNLGGSITTAGNLVFIGATNDRRFRAFDAKTGKQLWETTLEASAHTSPITYMGRDGHQYVTVMATGGGGFFGGGTSNTVVSFALSASVSKAQPVTSKPATFTPLKLSPEAAKVLVQKTCGTGCHSVEVVTSSPRMNQSDWDALVRNMVARGAQASEAERRLCHLRLSR